MSETAVPVLWSADLSDTLDFYRALGYQVTYEQTRPYVYGAVTRDGYELHFGRRPKEVDAEVQIGCLVMVGDVADHHREFTAALRARYGRIPASGTPRITRFRPGQSRFTLVDPSGNHIIYIQQDEPLTLDYGGSAELDGLAKVLDNARILRDFKNDDRAAYRVLEVGISRFGDEAPPVQLALALAVSVELAVAMNQPERAEALRADIRAISLSDDDRAVVAEELQTGTDLADWLSRQD